MLDTITINSDEATPRHSCARVVTKLTPTIRDKNRINVFVDDKFFCSLDISQVVNLKIKVGIKLSEEELREMKTASDFGKFYTYALEYVLLRPRSSKEIRDYLKKKTLSRKVRTKNRKTGEYQIKEKSGFAPELVEPVFERLKERGYINDERFAQQWVEGRNIIKGISRKKLIFELQQKGVDKQIIDRVLLESNKDDIVELRKVIARKRAKYPDDKKLVQYLLRLGFNYSDVSAELSLNELSD